MSTRKTPKYIASGAGQALAMPKEFRHWLTMHQDTKDIQVKKCWTGRLWISIGGPDGLAIGLGPNQLVERAYFGGEMFYPDIKKST